MSEPQNSIPVALLAVPEATAGTLFGMLDLFASVGRDWQMLMTGRPGPSRFVPRVVAARREPFRASNGAMIYPDGDLEMGPPPEIICIPDLYVAPGDSLAKRYDAEFAYLRERFAGGASIATACTGGLLLAEAGLLDGLDATIHWAYCDALANAYPKVKVHPNRALVATGDGQRLIMAGGGTSWLDLGLYMVGKYCGVDEAMRTARLHLIDWHDIGQQPFAVMTTLRQTEDSTIADCQKWIGENYMLRNPVAVMEQKSGLAGRSFNRRFKTATGMSPLDYIHTVRLEEAKQWLETSDLPVEAVAAEIGYEDASFFSRMFKRKVGLTPAQYRKRFGSLRKALQSGELSVR